MCITGLHFVLLVIVYQHTTAMATKIIQDSFQSGCGKLRYLDKTTRHNITYDDVGYKEGCLLAYSNRSCEQQLPICANFVRFQLPCPSGRKLILVLMNKDFTNRREYDCEKKPPVEYCGQYVYMFLKSDPWLTSPYSESKSSLQIGVTCTSSDTALDIRYLDIGIILSAAVIILTLAILLIKIKNKIKRNSTDIVNLSGESSTIRNYPRQNISVRYTAIPNEYVQMENNTRVQDQDESSSLTLHNLSIPVNQDRHHLRVPRTGYRTHQKISERYNRRTRQETTNEQHINGTGQETTRGRHTNDPRQEIASDQHTNSFQSYNQHLSTENLTISPEYQNMPYNYCHLQVIEGHDNL